MTLKIYALVLGLTLCHFVHAKPLQVYTTHYPPFQVVDKGQPYSGFSAELFAAAIQLTGLEVEYLLLPWARAQKVVVEQPNSLIFTLARTAERDELYRWVASIYQVKEGVFALASRADIKITSLQDVHNYSIALPNGDVSVKTLDIFPHHDHRAFLVEDQDQCISLLHKDRVDLNYNNDVGFFTAVDNMGLRRSLFKQIYLTRVTEMGIAANKHMDPDIMQKIRTGIVSLKQNGTYEKLRIKWFGE